MVSKAAGFGSCAAAGADPAHSAAGSRLTAPAQREAEDFSRLLSYKPQFSDVKP